MNKADRRSPSTQRGFTLIEIAIVLLIIGIITSFAALSFAPFGNQQLKQEAQKMARLLEYASQEAILTSSEIKLSLESDGYQFSRLKEEQWEAIDDGLLKPRQLPDHVHWRFESDADKPILGENNKKKDKESNVIELFFLSSGETSSFEIIFQQAEGDTQYKLTVNPIGSIKLETIAANAN